MIMHEYPNTAQYHPIVPSRPLCSKKARGMLPVFLRDQLCEIIVTAKMITWSTLYDINCFSKFSDSFLGGAFSLRRAVSHA